MRPPQVTLAAGMIMGGAALVVVAAFETISGLRSLEMRETLERLLGEPPYSGLGLDVTGLRRILQVATMVAAGCATAAAPLGYQVLRRNRAARVVLSVLAVPMLVAGFATSVFLTSVVAVSVLMLWLQPARGWFAGTWSPAPAAPPDTPLSGPPTSRVAGPPAGARPTALLWAAVLTWVFSGLALALSAFLVALVAGDPGWTIDQFRSQNPDLRGSGLSDAELVRGTYVAAGLLAAWSAAAVVAAALAVLGRNWGRVALTVSLAGTGFWLAVSVLLGQSVMLVPLLADVAAFWLLQRPEVRRWYAVRRGGMNA